jgi:hypothetical protein
MRSVLLEPNIHYSVACLPRQDCMDEQTTKKKKKEKKESQLERVIGVSTG